MTERNFKITFEYEGAAYLGWQYQTNGDSVEARLTAAVQSLLRTEPRFQVAGRTDAGVHALGQVASFKAKTEMEARRMAPGLNAFLPKDISVHRVEDVPLEFSARTDSTRKRYRYQVYNGPQPAAMARRTCWMVRRHLDVGAIQEAAKHLEGHLDFESFRSVHCDAAHARRQMFNVDVTSHPRAPVGEQIDILFHANAFCRHMCRILAGTLVEVGSGKRSPSDMPKIIEACDRRAAGVTAPPEGLTLLEVYFD